MQLKQILSAAVAAAMLHPVAAAPALEGAHGHNLDDVIARLSAKLREVLASNPNIVNGFLSGSHAPAPAPANPNTGAEAATTIFLTAPMTIATAAPTAATGAPSAPSAAFSTGIPEIPADTHEPENAPAPGNNTPPATDFVSNQPSDSSFPVASYTIPTEQCTTPLVRKAWHTLSEAEKQAYIDAELCLHNKPSRLNDPTSGSLYFDLVKAHQLPARRVHMTGLFLLFHRFHMTAHETLLRTECGYTGAQPYWEETLDAGAFSRSELLSGRWFGGNSTAATGCVDDGPFARFPVTVGPGYRNIPRCLNRRVSDAISADTAADKVEKCLAMPLWKDALACLSWDPHNGGHNGVGGIMADGIASPSDPLYYLHHTWLDKQWWRWQARWGSEVKMGTTVEGEEVRVGMPLDMLGLVEGARVEELSVVGSGRSCYTYQ